MDVTAIYELPVPVWVTCAALGATYPSGYGSVSFDIVLPSDHPPVGAAPAIAALKGSASANDLIKDHPDATPVDGLTVWTQEYGAFIPESLRPAVALVRVVVTKVQAPAHDTRTWAGPDDRLAEVVAPWFDDVRSWIEVMTGQDLDPRHRVYDAEDVAPGLTFISPSHDDSLGLTITTPRIRPATDAEWRNVMAAVRDGREPPLEELLSRDARAAHRRGLNRRAIVDAATATEVALAREVAARAEEMPKIQRDRLARKPMLGTLIDIAEASGLTFAVPYDKLRVLNSARIEAVHHGQAPGSWNTADMVQIAIDFLGAHGLVRRTETTEVDGSE